LRSESEVVAWVLENRRETETIEVKRSIELINAPGGPDKIEETIVAIANSALGQNGWLIFGIDNDSFELVGMLDLKMKNVVPRETRTIRRQQFSQIASRTKPSVSFEWNELSYQDKELIIVRIDGRRPGEFFQTSKGTAWYRINDHTYFADKIQIRRWLEEPELEEQSTSPVSTALILYVLLCLVAVPWAALWVLDPSQVARNGVPITLGLGFLVALVAHLKQWKTENMAEWCREKFPILLLATASIVPGAVMLQLSLLLYPALSGLYFETHLRDAPLVSLYALLGIIAGGVVLNLPRMSLTQARQNIASWIPDHTKLLKRAALAYFLVALATTSIIPFDNFLVLGTPRIGLVESRYVSDGVIHISETGYGKLEAYAVNQQTVPVLLPLVPLVSRAWYPLASNSTRECKVIRMSGISASLDKDQAGRLEGLWLFAHKTTVSTIAFVAVSYYSELNVSSVATITFHKAKLLQGFDNGTQQIQQTFEISNISPYSLHIGPIYLFQSTSQFEVTKNVTSGYADISYIQEGHWLYLNSDLERYGGMVVTVTYNRPAAL
jgi:hypothetical protein